MSHDISKWHYYEMECYEYLPSKLKHFYELDEFYRQIIFLLTETFFKYALILFKKKKKISNIRISLKLVDTLII
jgi:predicted transcriptional regulator